ncbi:MAG: hypothetical protein HZR80_09830 [Candidatus Heimdallarchaeota archaeon]
MRSKNEADEKETILYSEWVPMSKIVVILIILLVAVLITNTIIISVLEPQEMVLAISLGGALSILFLLIGLNFRGLRITLTKNVIKIKFGIFNKKIISLDELVSCEVIKASFGKYYGMGIRLGSDSSWAYITDFGDAVKLTYQESKLFVFSTKNYPEICKILTVLNENLETK